MTGIPTDRDSHLPTEALRAIKVTAWALRRTRLSGQEWPGGSVELAAIRSVDRGQGTDLPGAMVLQTRRGTAVDRAFYPFRGWLDACHLPARIKNRGRLAGLRLCMVMHVGSSGGSRAGRACWAAGQIGNRSTSPVNGCPQRIGLRDEVRGCGSGYVLQ